MPSVCRFGESISSSVSGIGSLGRLAFFFLALRGRSEGALDSELASVLASCSVAPDSDSSVLIAGFGYLDFQPHATGRAADR